MQAGLLVVLALLVGTTMAAPRIGVATMQPGEIFWERFGHNALVVVDPASGEATSYNYGFFDPTEPDFVSRFIRGEPRYRLAALPFEQDMAIYRDEGRGVDIQWLDLNPDVARELADSLAVNALPENAHYGYDYFLDNCSTRVRDAIDGALGGALRRQMEGRSQGSTYRTEAVRLASPEPAMWLGFDIGLGPSADRPLSRWAEAFVPMRLAAALRETRLPDGRPLVASEQQILPHRLAPEPQTIPARWPRWALAGLLVAAGLAWLGARAPRAVAGIAALTWAVAGLAGALMLFIWFGTAHRFGWANHGLLLFNPLCWLLLPGSVSLLRGRVPGTWFRWLLWLVAALPLFALFAYWLSALPQRHLHWIVLLWPVHLALAWTFGRHPRRAPPRRL
ncbi:lipoprotein N-acyltransferase Lnb domain-containing protein [Novilysobacter luteus]|uniref:DUF4105 domain-containing protein n=2 Tax=Lysobacteraceae TaxID=32033 RepID=A0ABM8UDZ8_9GAMM|nr:DUF4105 domain-containing protein [Lysobacter luteus]CAG4971024.1 hypothetical protein LYB30171_00872 [Lysobacter luteus]